MLKNVFLFTGEEKYLLDHELKRWKENFTEKFGKDCVFYFNSENFDIGQINNCIFAGGLFISKKLIIINGLPLDSDTSNKIPNTLSEAFIDDFTNRKGIIPDDVLLIFQSYKPDKRGRFYKFLKDNVTIKEFNNLKELDCKKFVKDNLDGYTITDETSDYFVLKVGNNLYRLYSEIEKIRLYCEKNKLTTIGNELIDNIVFSTSEIDSFAFFDYFFTDAQKLLRLIDDAQKGGIDRNQYAGMLYRGLKLYLFLGDYAQKGITDAKTIASEIKYHPFAVNKNIKYIDKILKHYDKIKNIYKNLIELDAGIKTGKFPDFYFWLAIKKMLYEMKR